MRLREIRIVRRDVGIRVRSYRKVAEVVNQLAKAPAAVSIRGYLAHGEVRTRERDAFGVDSDKDLGHCLDVEVVIEGDNANLSVPDRLELGDVRFDGRYLDLRIGS